ncbi:L,D-transpeptidase [Streptosporangiaceae bacterium NEAU-GS5]|nr:L,D-transpeptidase [Streptosporangiaceae bacterium NEAU-GS5]
MTLTACGTSMSPPVPPAAQPVPLQPVAPIPIPAPLSAMRIERLPRATTHTRLRRAPRDSGPIKPVDGLVTHPTTPQVIYARPGGSPVAVLPTTQLGSPTWVPVVQKQPGWIRVMLPSRPNQSTGWIYRGGGGLQSAYSAYRIQIDLAAHRLTVRKAGRQAGSWTVAVGAPSTPTPTGRTFLLASVSPAHPTYSSLILPLGTHSKSLDTFAGGSATIALHGWPDETVFGHAISHGCVRIPDAALRMLSRVPLGTIVTITA